MVTTSDLESTTLFAERAAVQFAAPEVLSGDTTIGKEADIFSFAMVVIEV